MNKATILSCINGLNTTGKGGRFFFFLDITITEMATENTKDKKEQHS